MGLPFRVFLFALVSGLSGTASAVPKDFYWQNKAGFLPADRCQIATVKEISFRISQSTKDSDPEAAENIRTFSGARKNYLLNRSLVLLTHRRAPKKHESIEVIGVSKHPKARENRWFAERLEDGYLHQNSLKDLADYVLELKKDVPREKIAETGIPLNGSFWQLAMDKKQPLVFRCNIDGKLVDHAMFDVYLPDQKEPVARVGVQDDETEIFRSILTHTTDEADDVIDSRMTNLQDGHNQSLISAPVTPTTSANAEPAKTSAAAAVETKPAAEVPRSEKPVVAPTAKDVEEDEGPIRGSNPPNIEDKDSEVVADMGDEEDEGEEEGDDEGLKAVNSSMEYTVCVNEDSLAVRDEDLSKVLFRADRNETLLLVQSWDQADRKKKVIKGTEYTFLKVQFPERNKKNNVGWLAEPYVRLEGQCPVAKNEEPEEKPTVPVTKDQLKNLGDVKNLTSGACCEFPTNKRPTHSYRTGMRRFKAGRSKGRRLHAACDLYRVHGEATVSVAKGTVVSGLYKFYGGTYALEVQHAGGFIARYGELTGKSVKGIRKGKSVKAGDLLGHIGTVNSGCCKPMLHFELYSGKTKGGSLTVKGKRTNRFQRRSDLVDPTPYLTKWEKMKFGSSY